MKNNGICPICSGENIELDLYQIEIPVLQNKVFEIENEAINSSRGVVSLSSCKDCTFVYNSSFNNDLIVYDTNYDNNVPSKLFTEYYHSIAQYLYDNYDLKNGVLYDVGCGKGTFLKILCDKFPDVKGIGIDPSYEGELSYSKNLTFIQDFFNSSHALEKPSLIISRHVFEHIEKPVEFLKIIAGSLSSYNDVPFFIEVPDLTWIIKNEAFWDVCYEHCNYFNPIALEKLVGASEATLTKITPSFKDQYLWCEGILNPTGNNEKYKIDTAYSNQNLKTFTANIHELKIRSKSILNEYKTNGFKLVIWGMATKGIEFCNIIDSKKELIDFCVDINVNKQGKHIPFTGHKIESPETILKVQEKLLVVVMNPNYFKEIKKYLNENSIFPVFISGHGEVLD